MEWLRIGELARRTGLTQRALRHYDEIGLLVPSGRSGGDYRLYSRADVERLLAVQHLKSLGLSLAEIAEALNGEGAEPGELLARHAEVVERRIAEEQELLARLRRLQRAAEASPGAVGGQPRATARTTRRRAGPRPRPAGTTSWSPSRWRSGCGTSTPMCGSPPRSAARPG